MNIHLAKFNINEKFSYAHFESVMGHLHRAATFHGFGLKHTFCRNTLHLCYNLWTNSYVLLHLKSINYSYCAQEILANYALMNNLKL